MAITPGPPIRWRAAYHRPGLIRYRAADPKRLAFAWNCYGAAAIGACLQVNGRVYSLKWASPVEER